MGREVGGSSGLGTRVHPWWIHVDVWQNQYNIVINQPLIKINKFKLKTKQTNIKVSLQLGNLRTRTWLGMLVNFWQPCHFWPCVPLSMANQFWSGIPQMCQIISEILLSHTAYYPQNGVQSCDMNCFQAKSMQIPLQQDDVQVRHVLQGLIPTQTT